MKKLRVELTVEELQTLVTMADNQLFRMKYIDSKIPGNVRNPELLRASQGAVQILQDALRKEKGFKLKENDIALKAS